MKVEIRMARVVICCVFLILISIALAVAFYVVIANWGNLSSIIAGVCLFSAFFFLRKIMNKNRNQTQYPQRRSTDDYTDDE